MQGRGSSRTGLGSTALWGSGLVSLLASQAPTSWSFNQLLVLLAVWTLVSKWNTKLALIWKEDFGPLGNSPVLLLLSPGKMSLMTTVAKFLDTSVCGALDALTPASVHSLWSSPKFLNRFCLTILIRLRFSRLVVHLFLPHFFLPLNFLLTCLDTALCEQLLCQWMFVAYPPCEGCQWLSSGQLSDQQSSPWLCSLVNQTKRPFWRLRKPLQVFWVDQLIGM